MRCCRFTGPPIARNCSTRFALSNSSKLIRLPTACARIGHGNRRQPATPNSCRASRIRLTAMQGKPVWIRSCSRCRAWALRGHQDRLGRDLHLIKWNLSAARAILRTARERRTRRRAPAGIRSFRTAGTGSAYGLRTVRSRCRTVLRRCPGSSPDAFGSPVRAGVTMASLRFNCSSRVWQWLSAMRRLARIAASATLSGAGRARRVVAHEAGRSLRRRGNSGGGCSGSPRPGSREPASDGDSPVARGTGAQMSPKRQEHARSPTAPVPGFGNKAVPAFRHEVLCFARFDNYGFAVVGRAHHHLP